ncbi:MAG: antitoxin [Spirochaetia bacterium]|jgi:predicted DNA binding CopG/RHH family protein|nr:antitoxin [Spirochaetia bacterium]
MGDDIKFLDREEEELYNSLQQDKWVSDFDGTIKEKYEVYARSSLKKERRINIRMTERDFKKIQVRAIQEGLPYQSLISMLIHKFNENKLTIN